MKRIKGFALKFIKWIPCVASASVNKRLLLVSLIAFPFFSSAQDLDARSPKEDKKVTRQQQSAEKKKEKQKIEKEKSEAQNLKQSEQLQTKETRKRMKKSRKKADAWNNQGKDSFFKNLFRKK